MKLSILASSVFLFSIVASATFSSCYNTDSIEKPPMGEGKGDLSSYFVIQGDHLYLLDNFLVRIYKLRDDGTLVFRNEEQSYQKYDRIFLKESNLFLGSGTHLARYTLTNPEVLIPGSEIPNSSTNDFDFNGRFVFQSDPINNLLVILDTHVEPSTSTSFVVDEPNAVCIDGTTLFLCSFVNGLKVYDISDVANIALLKSYENIKGLKVMAEDNILIVTSPTGIDQYDYADLEDVKLLSHIPVL